MNNENATILRFIGVLIILGLFTKFIFWLLPLGNFFRTLPVWFPKTFSEQTGGIAGLFLVVACIGYVLMEYEFNLVVCVMGIIIGACAIFFQNIWLIPILCVVAMIPFIAEWFCNSMFTGYLMKR